MGKEGKHYLVALGVGLWGTLNAGSLAVEGEAVEGEIDGNDSHVSL